MTLEIREKIGIQRWFYRFTLEGKDKRGWLGTPDEMTRRQATAAFNRIRAAIITKTLTPEIKCHDIKDIFDSYQKYLTVHHPATLDRQAYFFKKFKFFHKLNDIGADDIAAYQELRMLDKVSGATINRELQMARAAFNRATRLKMWLKDNPFRTFDRYHEQNRTRYLSEKELTDLLIACRLCSGLNPYLHDIVLIAIMTGKRKQEILQLHTSQIDFEMGIITKKATGTVKYKEDKVTPISQTISTLLRALVAKSKNGFLFENPNTGKPYYSIKKSFRSALKMAVIENFRFHDLRHTFATYALICTKDIRSVQEAIGHASIAQTAKYAHVLDSKKREVIDITNAFISTLVGRNLGKIEICADKTAKY